MSIKHAFESAKDDGADATLVRPSNWNAEHTITTSKIKAQPNATQSIPTATHTKVTLASEIFDTLGEFDPTTNYRFTAINPGYYLIIGAIRYVASLVADKRYFCAVYKNGVGNMVAIAAQTLSVAAAIVVSCSGIINLAAGDYIELGAYHDAGQNVTINSTADYGQTYLCVVRIL